MSTTPIGLDTLGVLTALHKDPRNVSEKEIAGILLRVWAVLAPQPTDGGEALLNAAFPGAWRTHPLVQLAVSVGNSMQTEVDTYFREGEYLKVWTQSQTGGLASTSSDEPPLPSNLMTPRDNL